MKNQEINYTANICKQVAKYSTLIGTGIFLLFCVTRFQPLMLIGLAYTVIAAIINIIFFLPLLIETLTNAKDRIQLLISMGIMLLNIPLTFIYIALLNYL